MQISGRPSRPGLGAYDPCRDITPPTMIRLPDVRGKLQSSFTVTCSCFRLEIFVFDTSAFSEFPELFVHNACCATSARTRTPQTAVTPPGGSRQYSCLHWSCPSAGCTARDVHKRIRKFQKCGRVNVDEYLSQQATKCRKCALRRPSSPQEAKHRTRSDFTTGHIGAYYRSEGLPRILPPRALQAR